MEKKVKQMYTEYTYPKYNENDDSNCPDFPNELAILMSINQINHYIYSGKKHNFNNYRILIAGCGLGGDCIQYGLLFKGYKNIEIIGIDLSPSSLDICKKRLPKYNLENDVKLTEMSLLDLDPKIHGKFDMITCIGVLHHLENPQKGLDAL